jgi:RNA polymerase sigma factor (sigma-70 family)
MPLDSPQDLFVQYQAALTRLYSSCPAAAGWGLSLAQFAEAVYQSFKRWNAGPDPSPVEGFLGSLHARDLAMAAACRLGLAHAWDDFVAAIARDDARGRELADSLYADLYGLEVREGRRRSLLNYFDGRSSLSTWLRAVLARRYIDSYRHDRRSVSLEQYPPDTWPQAGAPEDPPDPNRARYLGLLRDALEDALRALAPRDRLRLNYYYLQELTLRQIGQLLGEHESSVSRRLNRARKAVRRQVERTMRRGGLNDEQIRLCYDYATREWPFDLTQALWFRVK